MTMVNVGACMIFVSMAILLGMALYVVIQTIIDMFKDGDAFEAAAFTLMVTMLVGFLIMALAMK